MKFFHFDIFIRNKQSKMKRIIKDEDLQNVYDAKSLAPFLKVSERQIHYYRENGQLGCELKSRSRFQFSKENVIEFLTTKWGFEYER